MAARPLDEFQLEAAADFIAAVARESEDFALAREILAQWESAPESVKMHRARMLVENRAGGYQAAIEAADRALREAPNDEQAAVIRKNASKKLRDVVEKLK